MYQGNVWWCLIRIPFLHLVDIAEGWAPDSRRISNGLPSSHPQLKSMQRTSDQSNQSESSIPYLYRKGKSSLFSQVDWYSEVEQELHFSLMISNESMANYGHKNHLRFKGVTLQKHLEFLDNINQVSNWKGNYVPPKPKLNFHIFQAEYRNMIRFVSELRNY